MSRIVMLVPAKSRTDVATGLRESGNAAGCHPGSTEIFHEAEPVTRIAFVKVG